MKLLVTGASGFVGRALSTAVRSSSHELAALELRTARNLRPLAGVDAVIHLAGIAHRGASKSELQDVNVELSANVGRAAAAAGAHLVFLSSVKVHGEEAITPLRETSPLAPQDAYAESKARAEDALRAIPGLRLTVLRPPLIYGPAVKANFLALMHAIARGIPLPLASVNNRRSFLYVGNLADAIVQCAVKGAGSTYLISDGVPLSTPELCRRLGRSLGRPARLFPFPSSLLPRKLAGSLELNDSAIRHRLGWRPPFSLEEGLQSTAQWYLGR